MAPMGNPPMAAPPVSEACVSIRLGCADLDLNLAMLLPVKSSEAVPFQKLLAAFASVGLFGSGYDVRHAQELNRFEAAVQSKESARRERHHFYHQVEKQHACLTETMQTMKRD